MLSHLLLCVSQTGDKVQPCSSSSSSAWGSCVRCWAAVHEPGTSRPQTCLLIVFDFVSSCCAGTRVCPLTLEAELWTD